MTFSAKHCQATSEKTGQPCRQPAMEGGEFCRFHARSAEPQPAAPAAPSDGDPPADGSTRGAQPGNRNARKHGGYALQLLPEEEAKYREKLDLFSRELGPHDAFDAQVLHVLSLVCAKLDAAAAEGAPVPVLVPLSTEILKLLRSLKETRDSRDPEDEEGPRSFADFLAELAALEDARRIPLAEEAERRRLFELEREVSDLRSRLNLPARDDIEHKKDRCGQCRGDTEQRRNAARAWVCLKCGCLTDPAFETTKP
jgi:hypothetical protein